MLEAIIVAGRSFIGPRRVRPALPRVDHFLPRIFAGEKARNGVTSGCMTINRVRIKALR